jgi:hypothetical protein
MKVTLPNTRNNIQKNQKSINYDDFRESNYEIRKKETCTDGIAITDTHSTCPAA